jgi:hypothetical protein
LFFEVPARSLFDRAPFGGYILLFRLTPSSRSRFHRLRQVPDLRPKPADVSFFGFRVRIHRKFALPVGDKTTGITVSCDYK